MLDTITMERWEAYEDEWRETPPVDVLVAAYMDYKPPLKPGEKVKLDEGAMSPADFARWVKETRGSKMAPGA